MANRERLGNRERYGPAEHNSSVTHADRQLVLLPSVYNQRSEMTIGTLLWINSIALGPFGNKK